MDALQIFKLVFPDGHLIETDDELRYPMRCDSCAKAYEYFARLGILWKRLPLIAERQTWYSGGSVIEIAVVIRMVPEEDLIERAFPDHSLSPADEVPGEDELNSIWSFEEREQYEN